MSRAASVPTKHREARAVHDKTVGHEHDRLSDGRDTEPDYATGSRAEGDTDVDQR